MLDEQKILILNKLKGDDLINAISPEDLDNLPPDIAMKWCKARIQKSNKLNAKLGEINRANEIKRLEKLKLKELEEADDKNNSIETNKIR